MSGGENSPAPQMVAAADVTQRLREAVALHRGGRIAEAEHLYTGILVQNPNHPDALLFLGVIEAQRGRTDRALQLMERSLAVNPRSATAHYNRANLLRDEGRLEQAVEAYGAALALNPRYAIACTNQGAVLRVLGRPADALASYDRALATDPAHAGAHLNRGNVLLELDRCDEALDSYAAALARDASLAEAHDGRANALMRLNRFDEAAAEYQRAIGLSPANAGFLMRCGHALCRTGRYADALASFATAIMHDRTNPECHAGRAGVLMELRRFTEAVESYSRALELNPARVETLYGRGSAYAELGFYPEAIADLRRLVAARPGYPYALGMLVHAQNMSCDWTDPLVRSELVEQVRQGKRAASPFVMLACSDSPADLLRCARTVMRDRHPPSPHPLWAGERYRHDRIRLAYLSADFHEHPVGQLIAPVIGAHDRRRFEVTAISYGANDSGLLRQKLQRSCDRFIDITGISDFDAARLIRELEIDIAVDLTGLTGNSRPGILSFRPAPVQVNYLGYPGSLGSATVDYMIADETVIPAGEEQFYDEKIAWLPDTFLPPRIIAKPQVPVSRSDAGLPEQGFVFACFNTSYKLNAAMFSVWMRLLANLDGSVLWLARTNKTAADNLNREAERHGMSPGRLIFASRVPTSEEHIARLACADLFLDTVPYNAHSTAGDALAAGVPVLTCRGNSFAGRVAASLMQHAGLPEFIAQNLDEYEARAFALATRREAIAAAKAQLATHVVFDIHKFTRELESAYTYMRVQAENGLLPQSFMTKTALS